MSLRSPRITKRIVSVVDDEQDIMHLFGEALRKLPGLSVFTFTDPFIAYEHFKINNSTYALVISDMRMPGLDGFELLKKMKDLNPKVRTMLMTAFDTKDSLFEEFTKKQIINGFVQKPVKLDTLLQEASEQLHSFEFQKIYAL